jgi:hypothetical protein
MISHPNTVGAMLNIRKGVVSVDLAPCRQAQNLTDTFRSSFMCYHRDASRHLVYPNQITSRYPDTGMHHGIIFSPRQDNSVSTPGDTSHTRPYDGVTCKVQSPSHDVKGFALYITTPGPTSLSWRQEVDWI